MLCQPVAESTVAAGERGADAERGRQGASKGKGKGKGKGRRKGKGKAKQRRKRVEEKAPGNEGDAVAEEGPSRVWEARSAVVEMGKVSRSRISLFYFLFIPVYG